MVVMLRQCCCGCSLKTGSIIIGVLELIAGISNLVVGITSASSSYSDVEGAAIAIAVFSALLIVVAICLITGAVNSNAFLLVPWMLFNFVFMIVYAVTNIIIAAQNIADGYPEAGAGNIIGVVIYVLLQVYFILVVYSLFRELKGTAPPTNA
ncbi:uncharacterized protein [Periplaneta americana]|uniref:uncharacterized protein n=1 Tax=Periplaneta americana TaxID=6978 RepID=UPI0037E9154E